MQSFQGHQPTVCDHAKLEHRHAPSAGRLERCWVHYSGASCSGRTEHHPAPARTQPVRTLALPAPRARDSHTSRFVPAPVASTVEEARGRMNDRSKIEETGCVSGTSMETTVCVCMRVCVRVRASVCLTSPAVLSRAWSRRPSLWLPLRTFNAPLCSCARSTATMQLARFGKSSDEYQ
jgi:hypothetical protein